ncbi:SUKH-4 family immunity protein [Streptomyces sp. LHD-70]|uniref:SUKH-4 family immunity protein n=1 Tax=Streptomyces sp. LHD-70 TaxID=3072140 RepID=UPI0028102579|nr:SUKH-4 family immunity protein [Streptomyces sp. LHD-70]MDQ8706996.1 SUKH-4 family immunity protein [Streptomyces sp. LHD-70]
MPDIRTEDWALVEAWHQLPTKRRQVLTISGPPGSGKTAFLEAVRDRLPGSVVIDCTGLSADEVLLRMRKAARSAPEGEPVVLLLANAQYAGESVTSTEPARVVYPVAWGLRRSLGREARVAVERDPARMPLPEPPLKRDSAPERRYSPGPDDFDITLSADSLDGADAGGGTVDPRLSALAAAEQRTVPVEVWRILCTAAGVDATEAELVALAEGRPDVVVSGSGDALAVGFRDDSVLHSLGRLAPWGPTEQMYAVNGLLAAARALPRGTWSELGPVGAYVAHTLPVHAALAGDLSPVVDDGRVLAQCARSDLHTALAVLYPDGVPYASVPASVRYLEYQGIEPNSQGEWVAWLHHSAVTEGRTELAAQLLDSDVPLPWRTEWSRLRPMGIFTMNQEIPGRVEALGVRRPEDARGGGSIVTATGTRTDFHSSLQSYREQDWDLETGVPLDAPQTVEHELDEASWPCFSAENPPLDGSAVFARNTDDGWEGVASGVGALPPRCPESVTHGVRLDSDPGLWVLSGTTGLFAVRVLDGGASRSAAPFSGRSEEQLHTSAAPWPLPERAAAALRGEGLRAWLEETFGTGSCSPLSPDQLPQGLTSPEARRFLTDTGLPAVHDLIHLQVLPPTHSWFLTEVPWPGTGSELPWGEQAHAEAPTGGPFYVIGGWMYSRLLLDGTTGQLWRDTTGGVHEPVAGSSLVRFFAMVRLFDEFRRIHFPNQTDHLDAMAALTAWCWQIDAEAASREAWSNALEPFIEFEDNTWKFAVHDAGAEY